MNPDITLEFWARLFGRLALEIALVALLAAWLQRLIKPALWRRTIWQTALLSMVLLLVGELTGVNAVVAGWSHSRKIPAPISSPLPDLKTKAVVSVKILSTGLTPMPDASQLGTPLPGPAKSVTAVWWPAGIWLLGMLGAMTGVLARRFLFWWLRGRRVQPVTDERLIRCVGTLARRMGIRRPVRVIKRQSLAGPVAFGWWRPTVGLPDAIDSHFTAPQQEVMMAHELAHLAAHDPAWHFLADLACALLWWHPLAWWCRGRLLYASEMAADEASRLMVNGPGTLAECLVVMGRRLSQPVGFGWQRIEGNGFRSSLGRRVERLLAMPEHPWQPWGRTRQWLGILSGLITVVVLVATGMAWLAPTSLADDLTPPKSWRQTWQSSLAALALTAAISPADSMPMAERNSSGGLTKPGDKMEEQLFVRIYSVDEETLVPRLRKQSGASQATNELPQLFRNYLAQVVGLKTAPKTVAFNRNAGLLLICARIIDILTINRVMASLAGTETSTVDRGRSPNFEKDRAQFLANRVSTAAADSNQERLFTRIFKVDPNTFLQGLKGRGGIIGLHPGEEPYDSPTTNRVSPQVFSQLLAFFEQLGVRINQSGSGYTNDATRDGKPVVRANRYGSGHANDLTWDGLPDVALAAPSSGRTVFYRDRAGMLYVRATLAELDSIDTGIQFLNSSPAQVNIAVKFVEMSEEQAQALTGIIHPLPQLEQAGAASPSQASTNRPSIRGFMTDRQFREVIRSMETNSGIDILSAPHVTTLSGRQTQIAVQNARIPIMEGSQIQGPMSTAEMNNRNSMPSAAIVQEKLTTTIPSGPCLDVVPRVLSDGNAIRMTLTASLTNFQGNGNPDIDDAAILEASKQAQLGTIRSPASSSRFQVRQITTSATVWDGQTIVFGDLIYDDVRLLRDKVPVLGDIPMLGRLFRSDKKITAKKNLVIFVTPTLIDPAGNRIHTDDHLPFDPKTFPPQSGTQ